jgi:prevent-host-death family protein
MQITAKKAKDRFGEIMATAMCETVIITKHGRPETAMISVRRLEELEEAEKSYWVLQAKTGQESGYIGTEASEQLLADITCLIAR